MSERRPRRGARYLLTDLETSLEQLLEAGGRDLDAALLVVIGRGLSETHHVGFLHRLHVRVRWRGFWSRRSGIVGESRHPLPGLQVQAVDRVEKTVHHLLLTRCGGLSPEVLDEIGEVPPCVVGVPRPARVRLERRVHRRREVRQVDARLRVVMVSELEVVRDLVGTMARLLGLQLDQPQSVVPQHGVVRCRSLLGVMSRCELELVDEDRRVVGPAVAEAPLVQATQELQSDRSET